METRYLKTLLKVVETGSFSKAAELLHLTQSAVSQRIKFLEEYFGHQLLDRSGNELVSTEAGRLILARAEVVVAQEREMVEDLKRLGQIKRLSLCCTPTFGMAYLPVVLNDFILQNADLADLKFIFQQPHQAIKGVQENDYDLAIIEHCDNLDLSTFQMHSLPIDELVFVSAPHLGLPAGSVDLNSLLSFRLYARHDGCSSKQLLLSNLAACGKEATDFHSVFISDDLRFTLEAVLAGHGISFVSRSLVAAQLKCGSLLAHQVPKFQHTRLRTLFYPSARRADPLLQKFITCVQTVFDTNTKSQAS
ncbi:MAG: LysR family transcriptional regulator [Deltaproteobacteria bacterium HGW-Deltaproteobacteria-4]|nr:MAG: LysR family transcriptional regulator [Deltaproteobacteria bacterium HGW-Deltaproteobacteria-4]